MTSSHLYQPTPNHLKPKFRNFDTSSSNLTERHPPSSTNNVVNDDDSTPSSFRSEVNPPEASTTPFEEIFNPRLKRTSTSNYKSELAAAHRKGSDPPDAQSDDEVATRKKSEKSTFEKMSPQVYKRQLSIDESTDELAKKDQELDKMYSTNPRIVSNGLDQSLPSSQQQQHQTAATLSSSPEKKNVLCDLRDKLQHKLHLAHDHHHHHHHNNNGQEDIPNFSKYEFGLNKSDSVSTLGFNSDGNTSTEDASHAIPQGRRESFDFNEYKTSMFKKSLSGSSGVPRGESNTHQ